MAPSASPPPWHPHRSAPNRSASIGTLASSATFSARCWDEVYATREHEESPIFNPPAVCALHCLPLRHQVWRVPLGISITSNQVIGVWLQMQFLDCPRCVYISIARLVSVSWACHPEFQVHTAPERAESTDRANFLTHVDCIKLWKITKALCSIVLFCRLSIESQPSLYARRGHFTPEIRAWVEFRDETPLERGSNSIGSHLPNQSGCFPKIFGLHQALIAALLGLHSPNTETTCVLSSLHISQTRYIIYQPTPKWERAVVLTALGAFVCIPSIRFLHPSLQIVESFLIRTSSQYDARRTDTLSVGDTCMDRDRACESGICFQDLTFTEQ